ncbi:prepilin peptidase [Streptococcaceae bacterium ESL0687]|nr:prepilin peptidase [Streptococcaceae bacterium ESL0687]
MIIYFIYGSIFGSFFGLLIDRFPETSILFPNSKCDSCKTKLAFYDLIPILSQLFLKFKCRYCKKRTSIWYSALEIVSGIYFSLYYLQVINFPQLLLLVMATILSLYDIRSQTYPLVIWIFFNLIFLIFLPINYLFASFLGLAILAMIFDFKLGAGDLLFLASLSLFNDYNQILLVIQLSSLGAIFYSEFFKRKIIPFVPFLFAAQIIIMLFKNL